MWAPSKRPNTCICRWSTCAPLVQIYHTAHPYFYLLVALQTAQPWVHCADICFCFPGLNCMHTRAEWRRGGFWIHEEYCVVWVITLWSCRIGSNEPRICTEFTVSPEEKWVDDYSTFIGGRTITYKLNFDERSESSPPCWLSWVSLVTISRPSLACCLYSWKHLKMIDLKQLPLA